MDNSDHAPLFDHADIVGITWGPRTSTGGQPTDVAELRKWAADRDREAGAVHAGAGRAGLLAVVAVMTAQQTDLFGALAAPMKVQPQPAMPPAEEAFPVPPTLAWARRLTAAGQVGLDVSIHVSWLWTGEVKEALCTGPAGRALLHRDDSIREIKPDPGAFGRVIYLDPTLARELHARRRLIQIGVAGTHSARYRLARRGEAAPQELELPPGCDSEP